MFDFKFIVNDFYIFMKMLKCQKLPPILLQKLYNNYKYVYLYITNTRTTMPSDINYDNFIDDMIKMINIGISSPEFCNVPSLIRLCHIFIKMEYFGCSI